MPTLAEIEARTQEYANARENLSSLVWLLNEKIARLKEEHLPEIRVATEEAALKRQELYEAIAASRGVFTRPKTVVIMGVRVGFAKGRSRLCWDSAEVVVKRLKELFRVGAQWRRYVKVTEQPVRKALEQLPAATLAMAGVEMVGGEDEVVIAPVDSEVDKLVDALLGRGVPEQGEEEDNSCRRH